MSISELAVPPTDAISSVRFSPDGNALLVGSWDSAIHVYAKHDDGLKYGKKIQADAPILDLSWHSDGVHFYTVGIDRDVCKYNLEQGEQSKSVMSTHSAASNKVAFSREQNLLLSVSWDATMHVHDPDTNKFVPMQLAAKPFALALTADKALVAMAERKVHVFDLTALKALVQQAGGTSAGQVALEAQPWQQRESSLKFMTRAAACMPDGTGFASSSIEGRVGVEWFDEELNKNMYAFKCHRDKTTVTAKNEAGEEESKPVDIIYPVNAIAFHPIHGTFATGGGDGVVALWDAKTKRRIRQYPKLATSVAALEFSADGKSLAIGVSPGFEDGKEEEEVDRTLVKVYVRELAEGEAKGKPAKEKS